MGLLLRFRTYALKTSVKDEYQGIKIALLSLNDQENEQFIKDVKQALHLIAEIDPRRYRRVQAEIDYLVNTSLTSNGNYERIWKRCNIDFMRIAKAWSETGEECLIAYLACVIVHEATHGRLYSYGIPYEKETWLRIERLCRREEFHFAKRLKNHCEYHYALVRPLDEEGLLAFLTQSRWQRIKAHWSLLWRNNRDSKHKK